MSSFCIMCIICFVVVLLFLSSVTFEKWFHSVDARVCQARLGLIAFVV